MTGQVPIVNKLGMKSSKAAHSGGASGSSICDYLASADLCVTDVSEAISDAVNNLGFTTPSEAGRQQFPREGWDVLFARVNRDGCTAPTLFELLAPLDAENVPNPRTGRFAFNRQSGRAIRSHATVVMTSQFESVVNRVRKCGLRHWLQPVEDTQAPFPRLWIGMLPNAPRSYEPTVDFGLMLEFIPSSAKAPERPRSDPGAPAEVSRFVGIIARDFIVHNVETVAAFLQNTFDWHPEHPVRDEPARGYRFVTMSANHPGGAKLRLIDPLIRDASRHGQYLRTMNPGAGPIRIAASNLGMIADELRTRGISYRLIAPGRYEPEALIPDLPVLGEALILVRSREFTC